MYPHRHTQGTVFTMTMQEAPKTAETSIGNMPPIDNVLPSVPESMPSPNHRKPSKYSRGQKITAGILAGLLASGVAFGAKTVVENMNSNPVAEAPADPGEAPVDEVNGEQTPTNPNTLATVEQLAEMSDAEITALATISVESVTVDGKIDWNLYAEKLTQVMDLGDSAGTSAAEVEAIYQNGTDTEDLAAKYDMPFIAGFATADTVLDGYVQIHASNVMLAYKGNLLATAPVVGVTEFESATKVESSETGAIIDIRQHTYDNLFSSGVFDAENNDDVVQAGGRTTDLDSTITRRAVVKVIDGNIKLIQMSNVG
jgi:hypothetical protein